MQQERTSLSPQRWSAFVRWRLIPLGLIIPAGRDLHEWSPGYRDLVFSLAGFLRKEDAPPSGELVRRFRARGRCRLAQKFSDEELLLLFLKVRDYQLPVEASR